MPPPPIPPPIEPPPDYVVADTGPPRRCLECNEAIAKTAPKHVTVCGLCDKIKEQRYLARPIKGLCLYCDRPPLPGRLRCWRCAGVDPDTVTVQTRKISDGQGHQIGVTEWDGKSLEIDSST